MDKAKIENNDFIADGEVMDFVLRVVKKLKVKTLQLKNLINFVMSIAKIQQREDDEGLLVLVNNGCHRRLRIQHFWN